MAAETSRVVLRLTRDFRLVAAVAAAVGHFAEWAGLDARARTDLIAATEAACRETFPLLASPRATLGVTIEGFPDRVEVTLEHRGPVPPWVGRVPSAVAAGQGDGPRQSVGAASHAEVDRVHYKKGRRSSRVTLVKYLRAQPRGTNFTAVNLE